MAEAKAQPHEGWAGGKRDRNEKRSWGLVDYAEKLEQTIEPERVPGDSGHLGG